MPITKELDNVRKFKSVGFTNEQSETLADVIEQSHADSHQDLKGFINDRFANMEVRMQASQKELEAKLMAAQSDLLIKYSAIIAGFTGIAMTIAKLLW